MFELAKIITSNLYKLLFFTGIIIVMFFLVVPEYLEYKWLEVYKSEIEYKAKVENEVEYRKVLMAGFESKSKVAVELIKISKSNDEVMKSVEKYFEAQNEVLKHSHLSIYNQNLHQYYKKSSDFINKKRGNIKQQQIIGICVGMFLTLLGGLLWYVRIQRPIDIALKNNPVDFFKSNA